MTLSTNGYAAELMTLYGILEAGWLQRYPGCPLVKPWGAAINIERDCRDQDGREKTYLRLSRKGASGQVIEIANPGANTGAFVGVAIIDVFVPQDDGSPLASQYGDELSADFSAYFATPGALILRNMYFTDVGVVSTGGWYQGSLTIHFERHAPM